MPRLEIGEELPCKASPVMVSDWEREPLLSKGSGFEEEYRQAHMELSGLLKPRLRPRTRQALSFAVDSIFLRCLSP
jgi:hypothetical protein